MIKLVTSLAQAVENILTYQTGVAEHPALAARIKQHPAWYAIKDSAGRWQFGPSKFIGYANAHPQSYLAASYNRRDGKETEPALREWFEPVDLPSALGREVRAAFDAFAKARGKTANARWRVSVPREYLAKRGARQILGRTNDRIVFDPGILGGRPHIRGTRVGVSHILAALAAGDTADEIVDELPYIAHADIQAALEYAANSIDHPVLVAA